MSLLWTRLSMQWYVWKHICKRFKIARLDFLKGKQSQKVWSGPISNKVEQHSLNTLTDIVWNITVALQQCCRDSCQILWWLGYSEEWFLALRFWRPAGCFRRKMLFYQYKDSHVKDMTVSIPDRKVHGANMGPIWGRQDPGGPHVDPINFVIRDVTGKTGKYLGPFSVSCSEWAQTMLSQSQARLLK